jgi:hypothetical protein
MEQFKTASTILVNMMVMKYINTGDRLLDNSLIAVVSIVLSSLIVYTINNYKYLYNYILYNIKGYKTPTDFMKTRYYHESFNNIKLTNRCEFPNLSEKTKEYILTISKHNVSVCSPSEDNEYISGSKNEIVALDAFIPIFINNGRIVYQRALNKDCYDPSGSITLFSSSICELNEAVEYFIGIDKNDQTDEASSKV